MTGTRSSRPLPALRPALLALVLAGTCALPPVAANAQGATESSNPSLAISTVEEANPALALVPLRPQDEIAASIAAAREKTSASDAELEQARRRSVAAKGQLKIKREEQQTTQARYKVARQMQNTAEVASLKLQLDREKREIDYLSRTEETAVADVDRLEAERNTSNARAAAYERERELAALRTAPGVTGPDARLTNLVRRTLEAMKLAADRGADASARAKRVAEKRLSQLKALEKMAPPAK